MDNQIGAQISKVCNKIIPLCYNHCLHTIRYSLIEQHLLLPSNYEEPKQRRKALKGATVLLSELSPDPDWEDDVNPRKQKRVAYWRV